MSAPSSSSTPLHPSTKGIPPHKQSVGRLPIASSKIPSSTRVLRARSSSRERLDQPTPSSSNITRHHVHPLKRSLTPSQTPRDPGAKRLARNPDSSIVTPAPTRHLAPSTVRGSSIKPSAHQSEATLLAHERVRELTAELKTAQDEIRKLEKDRGLIEDESLSLQRRQLEFERELRDLNIQLDEREGRIKKLEADRKRLEPLNDVLAQQAALQTAQNEIESLREARKVTVEQLESLKQSLVELEQKLRLADHREARATQLASAAEERATSLAQNIEAMRKELLNFQKQSQTAQEELCETQKEVQLLRKLKQDPSEVNPATPPHSKDILRHELSRQVDRLKVLEQTNTRLSRELEILRGRDANIEILKEENRSLQHRLSEMEDLRPRLATAEVEREKLIQAQSEWTVYLNRDRAYSTPHELSKALATMRVENASLKERLGSRESEMKSRDRMISELEARLQEAETERNEEFEIRTKFESQLSIAERNRGLDKRRIEMLNEQLKSYTAEEKLLGSYDDQKGMQVAHFEELLEAHRLESSRLQDELARLTKQLDQQPVDLPPRSPEKASAVKVSLAEQIAKNEALDLELDELTEENQILKMEMESLQLQVDHLARDLGRGEFNSQTTQVLAPIGCPVQEEIKIRSTTLESLKTENRALLKRISNLEKGISSSSESDEGLVPRASLISLQHDLERLETEVARVTKSRTRLTEMYEAGTKSYRKAMSEILGYSLEAVANGEYRLRSNFNSQASGSLLFVPGKADGGSIEYKPNPQAPREVLDSFQTWIQSRQSLPCFTAAVTLEFYESSTRGQVAGYHQRGGTLE